MATKKDYYQVLGVNKNASDSEIKSAYRRLARMHHPDVDKSPDSESKFKEISEAYQILSNPEKKKMYDQFGHSAFEQQAGPSGGNPFGGGSYKTYNYSSGNRPDVQFDFGGFEDPFQLFEQIFGMGGFGGYSRNYKQTPTYQIDVSLEDSVKGGLKDVELPGSDGKRKKMTIKIPPGVDNGTRVRFEDVDIIFRVRPDGRFYREGSDIFSDLTLSVPQVILGDIIPIDTVWGTVNLKIPAGTEQGSLIRIKEKGMPNIRNTNSKGDHYVRIKIDIPKKLTTQEKSLYEQLNQLKVKKKGWF